MSHFIKIHPSKKTFITLMGRKGWLLFYDPQKNHAPGLSRDLQKSTIPVVSVTVNSCNRMDGSCTAGHIKAILESREGHIQKLHRWQLMCQWNF